MLPEITHDGAAISHRARHVLCHAPVQDAALFSRPCGPPELKRNRPKTQRTQATTTQHSDAATDGTVAPQNMLEGDSTAKVQLSQPVSALPGRQNRGSQPRVNQVLRILRANHLTARECCRRWQHGATQDAWGGRYHQSPALTTCSIAVLRRCERQICLSTSTAPVGGNLLDRFPCSRRETQTFP